MNGVRIERTFHVRAGAKGRKVVHEGEAPPATSGPAGRAPRVSRWMALAIHLEGLIREGKVRDYAEVARLGHVTRARVTQIMNLLLLAPDIQEALLFLPNVPQGADPLHLRGLQLIAAATDWNLQRKMWRQRIDAIKF